MATYDTLLRKTLPIAIIHGVIRKSIQLHNSSVTNYKREDPLYTTTKIALFTFGVAANITLWPVNICRDMYRIEAYLRGEYEKPTNIVEHILF
jgi:hypothetical protein